MSNNLDYWITKLSTAKHAAAVLEEKNRLHNAQATHNQQAVTQRHSVATYMFPAVKKTPLLWIA